MGHEVDDEGGFEFKATNINDHLPWYVRAGQKAAGPVSAEGPVDAGLIASDWVLGHGGQTMLDVLGFIPGVNVITEGVQSGYHAIHAQRDFAKGNDKAGKREALESAWHGGLAALNFFTLEGGQVAHGAADGAEVVHGGAEGAKVVHGAAEGAKVAQGTAEAAKAAETVALPATREATQGFTVAQHPMEAARALNEGIHELPLLRGLGGIHNEGLHAAHYVIDSLETAWDVGSNLANIVSGNPHTVPPLAGLPAWLATGEYKDHGKHGH